MTTPAVFPRQKAVFPDASGDRMSTFSVPNTSNRGCPSSLAGTTCRRDRSRISPCVLSCSSCCRIDRSGPFRRCVTHPRPPCLSATVPAYNRFTHSIPTQRQLATRACSNFPTESFLGLPIGGKRAFPSLTVSAPNSSPKYNSLQNRRDRRPSRACPVRRSGRADRSPFHDPDQGFVIVFRGAEGALSPADLLDVTHPHLKRTFGPLLSLGRRFGLRHAPPLQASLCHSRPDSALSTDRSPIIPIGGQLIPVSALPRPG